MNELTEAIRTLADNMKLLYRQQCQNERVVMFLDNSNFFGSILRVGREVGYRFRVDYPKLYNVLLRDRFAIDAFCYYSEWETDPNTRQRRDSFQTLMEKARFTLVKFQQRAGGTRENGVDAAIVRDMVNVARDCPRCDTFILIAGDGDYADTIREVRRKHGVKVEVAFFAQDTAGTLRDAAYRFIDLDSLRDQIALERPISE
jgi:uncharacterized LabA/DUF88 family protein